MDFFPIEEGDYEGFLLWPGKRKRKNTTLARLAFDAKLPFILQEEFFTKH